MHNTIEAQIVTLTGDAKLGKDLVASYNAMCAGFFSSDHVKLLQNLGVFVEAVLRVAEHIVFGAHTPLSKNLKIDKVVERLEAASGSEGIRIHAARLSRAAYDFRSRKKSVHLTSVDPEEIDAHMLFHLSTWVLIEILKESGLPDAEASVKLLATRKIPLVENVDGVLRTTKSTLSIPERILLLLYSSPDGLSELELLESLKPRVRSMPDVRRDTRRLELKDYIHRRKDGRWTLFGNGRIEAEKLLAS